MLAEINLMQNTARVKIAFLHFWLQAPEFLWKIELIKNTYNLNMYWDNPKVFHDINLSTMRILVHLLTVIVTIYNFDVCPLSWSNVFVTIASFRAEVSIFIQHLLQYCFVLCSKAHNLYAHNVRAMCVLLR